MEVALIYNKDCEYTTGVYIEKVMRDSGISCEHFWTENSDKIAKDYDLYFRIDHGDYKYDLPEHLHPAVFYAIDTHLKKPYKKIKRQAAHYDIVFCAQKEGADKLAKQLKIDTQWIPLGCDSQLHKRLEVAKKYDIGFVGSEARKFPRGRLIDTLRVKYPNSYIRGANYKEMSNIYSASRIGFNYSIINDINMRMFEIMSCGCFLLTNQIKNNGFCELFENRKHLVTYKNEKQLLELIEYYLKNEAERERIARAGYELVTKNYTYYHSVQKIFNYIAFKFGGQFNKLRIKDR